MPNALHRGARASLPAILATVLLAACGAGGPPSKFPARAEGCEVKVFKDAPRLQTENIGTVVAVCDESLSDDECVRQLKDEVCKVGGDVAWGVPDKPTLKDGKKRLNGRAAHTADGAAKK
jgi:hypothetical protein